MADSHLTLGYLTPTLLSCSYFCRPRWRWRGLCSARGSPGRGEGGPAPPLVGLPPACSAIATSPDPGGFPGLGEGGREPHLSQAPHLHPHPRGLSPAAQPLCFCSLSSSSAYTQMAQQKAQSRMWLRWWGMRLDFWLKQR